MNFTPLLVNFTLACGRLGPLSRHNFAGVLDIYDAPSRHGIRRLQQLKNPSYANINPNRLRCGNASASDCKSTGAK
jgi:hypothetical protein